MVDPATPGQAAPAAPQQAPSQPVTPGTDPANDNPPSSAQPPAQQPPARSEGTVTISTDEFAQLQRDRARLKGVQKRSARTPKQATATTDPDYDENQELVTERNRANDLERQVFQRDVKDRTRDLLAKLEYAVLPESTRKLILRNPHSLSEATDLDGVMMDVEDFLREESAAIKTPDPQQQQLQQPQPGQQPAPQVQPQPQQPQQPQPQAPQGHETPPNVGAGSPQAPAPQQLEDTSNLTGTSRSRAVLRNSLKKARGVQG